MATDFYSQGSGTVQRLAGGNLLGRWTRALSDQSELQVQLYYDRTERDSPYIREERDILDADLQHRFALTPRQELVWACQSPSILSNHTVGVSGSTVTVGREPPSTSTCRFSLRTLLPH